MKSRRGRSLLTYLFAGVLLAIPLAASAVDYTVSTVVGGGSTVGCTTTPTLGSSFLLNGLWGIGADAQGNIYYTERTNYVVCKLDSNGYVTRVAGTGVSGFGADNIQATSSALNEPINVISDAVGNLYIADYNAAASIRKVSTTGVITTIYNTSHGATYGGDNGPATAATGPAPIAMAVSPSGEFYFENYAGFRIRKIDANGNVQLVAGTGTNGSTGDGGPALSATIGQVPTMVFDSKGDLYLAQYSGCIRKITMSTGFINRFAGSCTSTGSTGDGGPATSALLQTPWGIAIDKSDDLYILARTGYTVRKVTSSTGYISTIAGQVASTGSTDGSTSVATFGNLFGAAISSAGDIYVLDYTNNKIRKIAGAANMSLPTAPEISFTSFNKYRLTSTINASGGVTGKLTFYANGKRIPGCISVTYSGTYSCSWKPAGHGGNTIYASVSTSGNGTLKSSILNVGIGVRTTLR